MDDLFIFSTDLFIQQTYIVSWWSSYQLCLHKASHSNLLFPFARYRLFLLSICLVAVDIAIIGVAPTQTYLEENTLEYFEKSSFHQDLNHRPPEWQPEMVTIRPRHLPNSHNYYQFQHQQNLDISIKTCSKTSLNNILSQNQI